MADFYSACSAELTSNPNTDVLQIYDTLYTILPIKTAICSQDDGGNYCSTQAKLPASSGQAAQIQKVLAIPADGNVAALVVNGTTFGNANIPFLFLQPSLSSADLCNVCTRKILNAYLNFEAKVPYAPGMAKSFLLSNQPALYLGIQNTCGSSFLSQAGVVQAAGGLSGGALSNTKAKNSATQTFGTTQGFFAAGLSIVALLVSSVF